MTGCAKEEPLSSEDHQEPSTSSTLDGGGSHGDSSINSNNSSSSPPPASSSIVFESLVKSLWPTSSVKSNLLLRRRNIGTLLLEEEKEKDPGRSLCTPATGPTASSPTVSNGPEEEASPTDARRGAGSIDDYVGLALKHWSVYLGNALLNYINKECKGQTPGRHLFNYNSSSSSCCYHHVHHHSNTNNHCPSNHESRQSLFASAAAAASPSLHQGYYNYAANGRISATYLNMCSNSSRLPFVQGKDPSVEVTQDMVEESEDERCFDDISDSVPPVELPPCELARLEEISELVSSCLSSPMRREKLAVAIESETYINKLLNLFHVCEDLDNIDGLHHLYDIFKNIFFLNKNSLFELMFSEDTIFDVVGCLEFDPNLPTPKKHRQYLRSIATFHKVININNVELLSKIHQTYRVQYIQDVVLPPPSVFEENMLSTLSSFIFFNKVEIVSLVQEDEQFLNEFFNQLMDESTDEHRRRELVLFLKEFCTFSQTLQPQARESFFKTLNSLGILSAMEITLASNDKLTKSASIDVLLHIVEFSASMVREHMHPSTTEEAANSLLMNIIIRQMNCDSDPEMSGAVQLMGIIKTLLDPENMLASVNKSEKTDFLNYFYKNCMRVLIEPLLDSTSGDKPATMMDTSKVQLLSLILELLSFCVEHHTYHIKNYILQKDLLRRILILMSSKHTFLVLCALRFMRKIVALKDEYYNRYIIKGSLFEPVISAFINNNGRYNLLDSAILEMFEFIKLEDIKTLCTHVVEKYSQTLDKITYVQTFKTLKSRYDQHQDRLRDHQQSQLESVGNILRPGRYRRDPRQVDEDEEMWFNSDVEIGEDAASTQLRNTSAISNEAAALAANAAASTNNSSSASSPPSLHHDAVPITQSIVSTSSTTELHLDQHSPESTNGRLIASTINNGGSSSDHQLSPQSSINSDMDDTCLNNTPHDNEKLEMATDEDEFNPSALAADSSSCENNASRSSSSSSPNSSSSSTMKKGLVDYDSDEEDAEESMEESSDASPADPDVAAAASTAAPPSVHDDDDDEVESSAPPVKRQRTSLNSSSSSSSEASSSD